MTTIKLDTKPRIERAFNEHYKSCYECQEAVRDPVLRKLCVTGQMLSTLLIDSLTRKGKKK